MVRSMGDHADALTDDGMQQLDEHRRGECETPCPYCEHERRHQQRSTRAPWRAYDDVVCGECGSPMTLKPSRFGLFYSCTRWPECDGTHGAHPNGEPLGVPANKATKLARRRAHDLFDQLYSKRGRMSRTDAYTWLAKRMQLTKDECHIGRFTIAQCDHVIELVTQRLKRGFKNG